MFKLGKEEALFPHFTMMTGEITKIYPLEKVAVNNEIISRLRFDVNVETESIITCSIYRKYAEELSKYLYVGRTVTVDTTLVIRASKDVPGEIEYSYKATGPVILGK